MTFKCWKPLTLTLALITPLTLQAALADSLTVYSAGPGALIENLASDFETETGIEVNVFQSTTGNVLARLDAEQSNPVADVLVSASWDSAADLKNQDRLLAYTSPNAETVPDFLKDSHYVAQGVSALSLAWNTQSDVPRPSEWADLTDPVYADEITMPDPAQSGTAYQLVTGLLTANGESATWDLFSDLNENGMIVPGPNARALNPVLQGAKSVVFGAVDYIALGQAAAGESVEVIFPESGTVVAPRPIMIMKSTQQPDNAKQFIDFVLSEQGQERVAERYLMPARSDMEALRPTISELNVIDVDADAIADRDQILSTFGDVTGQ